MDSLFSGLQELRLRLIAQVAPEDIERVHALMDHAVAGAHHEEDIEYIHRHDGEFDSLHVLLLEPGDIIRLTSDKLVYLLDDGKTAAVISDPVLPPNDTASQMADPRFQEMEDECIQSMRFAIEVLSRITKAFPPGEGKGWGVQCDILKEELRVRKIRTE